MSKSPHGAASALEPARVTDIVLEVAIAAEPGAVWNALTDDIGRWWPRSFYCGAGTAAQPRFLLEAFPGGRMWEDWGDGNGLLWGTVLQVRTGKRLELAGTTGPAWGGPATWIGTFELTADGSGTKLRFTDSCFGRASEAATEEKEKGWRFLFEGALKAYCEGRPAPEWED